MSYPMTKGDVNYLQRMLGTTQTDTINRATIDKSDQANGKHYGSRRSVALFAQRLINERRGTLDPIEEDGWWGPISEARLRMLRKAKMPGRSAKSQGRTDAKLKSMKNKHNFGNFDLELTTAAAMANAKWPVETTRAMTKFFGKPGTNHAKFYFPYQMWYGTKKVRYTYVNKKVKETYEQVFEETLEYYGLDNIRRMGLDAYSGCFNNRNKKGGSSLSTHAFAASIDLNSVKNRLHWNEKRAQFAGKEYKEFFQIQVNLGLVALGPMSNFDYMHSMQATRHRYYI